MLLGFGLGCGLGLSLRVLAAGVAAGAVAASRLIGGDGVGALLDEELLDVADVLSQSGGGDLVDEFREFGQEVPVVADDDERAVVVHQRLLQHVLGLHVQVVGGLVEDQQVVGVEQEFAQGEARLLSSRQDLDLLVHVLAAEEERAEQGTDLFADLALGFVVDGLEDGQVAVELVALVLGVVSDVDVVAEATFTVAFELAEQDAGQGGLARTVLADEGHLVLAGDHEVHIAEDLEVVEALRESFGLHDHLAGSRGGREAEAHFGVLELVHLDALHLVELFDEALGKGGLVLLRAELVDQLFGVGDVLLLLLGGLFLPGGFLFAPRHVFAVRGLVVVNAEGGDFHGAVGHVVEEGAVVGDEDHRPRVVL